MESTDTLICPICQKSKSREAFPADRIIRCKLCHNLLSQKYKRSREGLPSKMYGNQRGSSRARNHSMPNYTGVQLKDWLFKQPRFETLYEEWVESGFERNKTPSCDRLDDSKPYTLNNLQLTTAYINNKKQSLQRKYGSDLRVCRPVTQMDLLGNELAKFHSIAEAKRRVPTAGDICTAIAGTNGRTQTGGFRWKYTAI